MTLVSSIQYALSVRGLSSEILDFSKEYIENSQIIRFSKTHNSSLTTTTLHQNIY